MKIRSGLCTLKLFFLMLTMCSCTSTPLAQSSLAQSSIGSAIQNNFRTLTSQCFGNDAYNEKFLPATIVSHPMALETNFKKVSNVSFNAISTLVYERQDLSEAQTAGSSKFLSVPGIITQNITQNPYYSSLTFSFSCISALQTALSAGLNPLPHFGPALNIQAGMNAELNNNANTGLIVLYGRFQSPFSAMLQGSNPAKRMSAYSAIWRYYLNNPTPPDRIAFLDFLEGWLVTSTTARDAAESFELNGSANAHALILNADWTAKASVKYNSAFQNQNFDIYVVPKPGGPANSYNFQLYALPKPADISTELRNDSILYPTDVAQVIPGQLTQLKLVMPGLDSTFCDTPQWEVSMPPPNVVVNSQNSMDADGKACIINSTIFLTPALGVVGNAPIKVFNTVKLINGNQVTFSKNLVYQNAAYPVVHLSDLPKVQPIVENSSGSMKITVDVPFSIEVAPGTPTPNDVRVTGASLTCQPTDSTKPAPPTASALIYSYVALPTPTIHSIFPYSKNDFIDSICNWTALIDFSYNGGAVLGKKITAQLSISRAQLPAEIAGK